ncbi:MAG: hypothetical protein EA397_14890 [Deltaproteobacteria bacterium]|nr:MAG: hypothetical protein EA397_14890 [Deltaproteobacteria bacterium]
MFVEAIHLRDADGRRLDASFEGLRPGLNLVYGPNASGKSTLGAVLRATLWPESSDRLLHALTSWRSSADGPSHRATLSLRHVAWHGEPLSAPAGLAPLVHLSLYDLLASNQSDADTARAIQTQLDGGFDLRALEPPHPPRQRPLPSKRGPYEQANDALATLLANSDALARREASLGPLRERLRRIQAAPRRRALLERAKERLEVLSELEESQRELAETPSAPQVFPSDAVDRAQELTRRIDRAKGEAATHRAEVQAQEEVLHRLGIAELTLSEARAEGLVRRAQALIQELKALRRAEARRAEAEAALRACEAQVHAVGASEAGPPSLEDLEQLEASIEGADREVRRLEALPEPEAGERPQSADALREARAMLNAWLRAPRPLVEAPRFSGLGWGIGLGLSLLGGILGAIGLVLLALYGVAGGILVGVGCLLFGAGVGVLGVLLQRQAQRPGPLEDPSEAIAARYRDAGYPAPDRWQASEVEAKVRELERQIFSLESAHAAFLRRQEQRGAAAKQRERVAVAKARRDALVARLGIEPGLADLTVLRRARRLHALDQARADVARARAAQTSAEASFDEPCDALRAELIALGLPGLEPLDRPDHLLDASQHLRDWVRRRAEALSTQREHRGLLAAAEREHQEAAAALDQILQPFGLGPEAQDRLPERVGHAERCAKLRREIEQGQARLAELERGLPEPPPQDLDALHAELQELDRLLDSSQQTHAEIAEIEAEIIQSRRGRSVEQALADQEVGLDVLTADLFDQAVAHTAQGLIEWLRRTQNAEHAPALLTRARRWFSTFTQHRYALQVDADLGFRAHDLHHDRLLTLPELSDGTRVQLLLAARLAYLEHSEGDRPVPLFLDEALSTSDPHRFAEVARAILELASQGRQIFYATSSAEELRAWEALAERSGHEAPRLLLLRDRPDPAWAPRPALPVAPRQLPPVAGRDAVSWCDDAGLTRPTLYDSARVWPLALLLHDHLPQAARAAERGLLKAAQLDLAEHGGELPLAPALLTLARQRCRIVRATVDALRIGRGRPFSFEQVLESGAITKVFEDRVRGVYLAHGHDARAFLRGVDDLSRWQSAKQQELTEHLREIGALDERARLSPSEVVARVQRALAGEQGEGLGEIRAFAHFVHRVVLPADPDPEVP